MARATSTGMVSWEKSREKSRNLLTLSKCIVSVLCTQAYSLAKYRGGGAVTMRPCCPYGKWLGDIIIVWFSLAAGES